MKTCYRVDIDNVVIACSMYLSVTMVEEIKKVSCPVEQPGKILSVLNSLGLLPFKPAPRNYNETNQSKMDLSMVLIKQKTRYVVLNIILPEALSLTALLIYLFAKSAWDAYFANLHREESVRNFTLSAVFAYHAVIIQVNVVGAIIMVNKANKIAELNGKIRDTLPKLILTDNPAAFGADKKEKKAFFARFLEEKLPKNVFFLPNFVQKSNFSLEIAKNATFFSTLKIYCPNSTS